MLHVKPYVQVIADTAGDFGFIGEEPLSEAKGTFKSSNATDSCLKRLVFMHSNQNLDTFHILNCLVYLQQGLCAVTILHMDDNNGDRHQVILVIIRHETTWTILSFRPVLLSWHCTPDSRDRTHSI